MPPRAYGDCLELCYSIKGSSCLGSIKNGVRLIVHPSAQSSHEVLSQHSSKLKLLVPRHQTFGVRVQVLIEVGVCNRRFTSRTAFVLCISELIVGCVQVVQENRGGILVLVEGLRGFVPLSHVATVSPFLCTSLSSFSDAELSDCSVFIVSFENEVLADCCAKPIRS